MTTRKPNSPSAARDTVPDFEDEDDTEWEDDFASIGDCDHDRESTRAN